MFLLLISPMDMSSFSQMIHFVLDPHFLYFVMALYSFSFANKLTSLTLTSWPYCHYLNDSTASLLLFLVPIIVVISHGFWVFFGNFLILFHSASLVPLFCLVLFCSLLTFPLFSTYELFIYLYALFIIHTELL
jgi:hypothetical protein